MKYADKIRVAVCAAKPDRAETEARRLAKQGAKGLLSFGFCGGLDPKLKPGDLVAPRQILSNGDVWGISPFWVGRQVIHAEFGLGRDKIVSDVDQKADLFKTTRSAVVDMESHRIGKVCNEMNIPFFVLRAVSDPADQAIPKSATNAIDKHGNAMLLTVAGNLLKNPREISDLIRLKKQTDIALGALKSAAAKELPLILRSVELV